MITHSANISIKTQTTTTESTHVFQKKHKTLLSIEGRVTTQKTEVTMTEVRHKRIEASPEIEALLSYFNDKIYSDTTILYWFINPEELDLELKTYRGV